MKFIETYLTYLHEGKLKDLLKRIGLSIRDLYFERPECKELRQTSRYMYLFHGTRPEYVDSIKKHGLLTSFAGKRTKDEGDLTITGKRKVIWFISVANKKSPGFGTARSNKKGVVLLLAKLDTRYLEHQGGVIYLYSKDVPPKDIVWETDKKFDMIVSRSRCLQLLS